MAAFNRLASSLSLALSLSVSFALAAPAVKGILPDGSLDKPTVSKAYFEGEFWTVINALEAFRKSDYPMNRDDSVYTFKYLSVVYAADPDKRVKAESHMYQLVRMMPTIDLLDLYISDNIQSIFTKVKSEVVKIDTNTTHKSATPEVAKDTTIKSAPMVAAQAQPQKTQPPASSPEPKVKSNYGLNLWGPIALGGVGIATATYFLISNSSESGSSGKTARPVDVTLEWPKEGTP